MRALILLSLVLIAVPDRTDPSKKDAKPLQEEMLGEWRLVKAAVGGDDGKKVDGTTLIVTKSELLIREKGRDSNDDASYRLDDKKKPAAIDIMPKRGDDKKIEGIIKIEGDTMTLCFPHDGQGTRPVDFSSPAGTRVSVLQFQRIKK